MVKIRIEYEVEVDEHVAEHIQDLQHRLDTAEQAIAWANNSLVGSFGFFLSMDGGPPDEHHLDRKIEELKTSSRRAHRFSMKLEEHLKDCIGVLDDLFIENPWLTDKMESKDYKLKEHVSEIELEKLQAVWDAKVAAVEYLADMQKKILEHRLEDLKK